MRGETLRHRRHRLWIGGLAIAVALGLLHGQILTSIAAFMSIRDPLEPADLIIPLYREEPTVLFAAAELYHRGYAERVALGRTRPTQLEALGLVPPLHQASRGVLEAAGVAPEAIVTLGSQIRNDVELARAVADFLSSRGKSRIIVVTSAPWSRVRQRDLRRGLAGSAVEVRMYPVRPGEFDERTWWRSRHGWVTYFDVYYLWLSRFLRD